MAEKWGIYPWFPEHGIDLIHPDDRDQELLGATVREVINDDADYLFLQAGEKHLRAKPGFFMPVQAPKFVYGEQVRTRPPRTVRDCIVVGIAWHMKRQEPMYFLQHNGK